MLSYNMDHRMSAGQALKHAYFKDLRDLDRAAQEGGSLTSGSQLNNGMMRLTQRGAESMSQNSKSMSKISDNVSEGSYQTVNDKKKNIEKFRATKQGAPMYQTNTGLTDLKIDNIKTQTFNSDVEENYAAN